MGLSAALEARQRRRFCLILIKPSHYDDDGYVIQWLRSPIPSNSLAALYGLARDCAERALLGPDVDLDIHAYDETNARIRPDRLARMIARTGNGMVMLVGVQSNQFPARSRRPTARASHQSLYWWFSCLRHNQHAQR